MKSLWKSLEKAYLPTVRGKTVWKKYNPFWVFVTPKRINVYITYLHVNGLN